MPKFTHLESGRLSNLNGSLVSTAFPWGKMRQDKLVAFLQSEASLAADNHRTSISPTWRRDATRTQ